jgi:hypothetical protein
MECPYFESQSNCACPHPGEPHLLEPADIEGYCRRNRYVFCPIFKEFEEVIDLSFDDREEEAIS